MGKIHSIETMGLTDGPGIRTVFFFQGCNLRCRYCHNPDTWKLNEGVEMSSEVLLQKALRYRSYFNSSRGGVTCSGGEPLLQPEFLIELLEKCKRNGLHTAIDTSGYGIGHYEEILKHTDLIILDIKAFTFKGFNELTGGNMAIFWDFINALNKSKVKVWIRHVVVPGRTDSLGHIKEIKSILSEIKRIEKVELLPYHTLGVHKYESMKIPNPLKVLSPMCEEKLKGLEKALQEAI